MRSSSAFHNLAASLILQFVTAVIGIILPRLIIEAYGSSMNGMIASINQFLVYLALVEAGLGAASIAALYGPLASRNMDQVNSVLSASWVFYKRTGIIFSIGVAAFVVLYPFLVYDQVPVLTAAVMVLIMAGSGLTEYFIIGKYRVLLLADQKSYVISLVQTLGVILNAIVSIVLIEYGFDVLIMQSAATLIFVSRVVLVRHYVRRKYEHLSYKSTPDFSALDRRWDAFIHQMNGLVVYSSPTIIITIFCSLSDVSVYSVYNMVFVAVNMFIASFSSGLIASFGQVIANGEKSVLQRSFSSYEYLFYAVLTWAYAVAAVLFLPFINIYTTGIQDANYFRPDLAALFVVIGIVSNIRVPYQMLVQASGHYRETKKQTIIEAIISLTASLILVQWFGMIGVLLGMLCAHLYRTPELIWYASKHILQQKALPSVMRIMRSAFIGAAAVIPMMTLFTVAPGTLLEWCMWGIVTAIVVLVIVVGGNAVFEPATAKDVLARLIAIYKSIANKFSRSRQYS